MCNPWLQLFKVYSDIFFTMITEDQKYVSGIYKNIGFAFLSPIGAIAFQYLVFDKPFTIVKLALCLSLSAISWILFYIGYNYVQEKRNVRA